MSIPNESDDVSYSLYHNYHENILKMEIIAVGADQLFISSLFCNIFYNKMFSEKVSIK